MVYNAQANHLKRGPLPRHIPVVISQTDVLNCIRYAIMTVLSRARKGLLVEEATKILREAMLSGKLEPGQRLVQSTLGETLGISRTPLREALFALAREGLVTISDSRRVRVTSLEPHEAAQIYEVRETLEGLAARLAASRANSTDLRRLRNVLEKMATCVENGDARSWIELNTEFHQIIADATGNGHLKNILTLTSRSLHMFYPMLWLNPERPKGALAEHLELYGAIADGDAVRAEELARTHVFRTSQLAAKALNPHQPIDNGQSPDARVVLPITKVKGRPKRRRPIQEKS